MKTIKYFSLIICLIFSISGFSQKFNAYTLELPNYILKKGGPIYVSELTDISETEIGNSLSTSFQSAMIHGIQAEGLATNHNIKDFNPWFITNLYSTTDSIDKANYVITGEYNFTTNHTKSYTEETGVETTDSLPFVYYKFNEKSTATVSGKIIITDSETGNEIATIPYSTEKIDEDTKTMKQASVKDPMSFISALTNDFTHNYRYQLSAVKLVREYEFPKIKAENKDLKKEFRQNRRDLKDMADEQKLKDMFSKYIEIQQKEDSPEVNECIGMCYEILGNYSKAKTYYETAKSQESLNRINKQINIKNTLSNLGIETTEPEF